jgi:UDP-N-acetyl-D-galactosamine dehydrogenase
MGVTFKEDVPDLRNSRVVDVVRRLQVLGHDVVVHDPLADPGEAEREYGLLLNNGAFVGRYDLVVAAVAHRSYREMAAEEVRALTTRGGAVADLKAIWRGMDFGEHIAHWTL